MLLIPTIAIPSQQIGAVLANQVCQINIYQKFYGLFLDLFVSSNLIIGGVVCENVNLIVRDTYLGFSGDFVFLDNQGFTDPVYTGLGSRYSLIYLSTTDLQNANIGLTIPSGGILTGVPPTVKGGGSTPPPSGLGAPTQFNSAGLMLPWSAAINAQFNGYAHGAQVATPPVRGQSIPSGFAESYVSTRNNNKTIPAGANNPPTAAWDGPNLSAIPTIYSSLIG